MDNGFGHPFTVAAAHAIVVVGIIMLIATFINSTALVGVLP